MEIPGLSQNKLTKCSSKPNCVCSEFAEDTKRYIEPLKITGTINVNKIEAILTQMGGIIITKTDTYIAANFTSSVFKFVDDFEIKIDQDTGNIHFRSASRVGYSDRGVNKKRVELFKQLYKDN